MQDYVLYIHDFLQSSKMSYEIYRFHHHKLNKRMSGHRANIINGTEGFVMLNHLTKRQNVTDMVIKPIDICDSRVLRKREEFWIQELNTIFPYGLNSRIDIEDIHDSYNHIKNNNAKPIYKAFNTVKNNHTKRGSGKQDEGTISHNHKNLNPADVITSSSFV